jgi:hypothetical protein
VRAEYSKQLDYSGSCRAFEPLHEPFEFRTSHFFASHSRAVGAPVMPMCFRRPHQIVSMLPAIGRKPPIASNVMRLCVASRTTFPNNKIIHLPCLDRGCQSTQEGHCHRIDATFAFATSTAICDPALAGLQFQPARNRKIRESHQPGTKPGSHRWQRCILPLDH